MDIRSKIESHDWAWVTMVMRRDDAADELSAILFSRDSESLFLVEAGVWTLFDLHEYGVFENPKSMATVDQ